MVVSMESNKNTLSERLNGLSNKQKVAFFDIFWKTWFSNGFGTLTKKDTELLIFICLKSALGDDCPQNNYDWAILLKLTPSKVKTMRLESHLRFGHVFEEDSKNEANSFVENFTQLLGLEGGPIDNKVSNVKVSFIVEDPVVQMEIEKRLKDLGHYIDFHRNREVIKINLAAFLELLSEEKLDECFEKWQNTTVKANSKAEKLYKELKDKIYSDKPIKEKLFIFSQNFKRLPFGYVYALLDDLRKLKKSF
jgi:hypothetical protein